MMRDMRVYYNMSNVSVQWISGPGAKFCWAPYLFYFLTDLPSFYIILLKFC